MVCLVYEWFGLPGLLLELGCLFGWVGLYFAYIRLVSCFNLGNFGALLVFGFVGGRILRRC